MGRSNDRRLLTQRLKGKICTSDSPPTPYPEPPSPPPRRPPPLARFGLRHVEEDRITERKLRWYVDKKINPMGADCNFYFQKLFSQVPSICIKISWAFIVR